MAGLVAIVGRPNVGKSTLFNRLTESKHAIVHETPGVTRDRHYGKVLWNGKEFSIIDTGGYIMGSEDEFETEIRKQVNIAVEEADLILFLVDVNDDIHPLDEDVAGYLRRSKKKVILVANKVDNNEKITHTSVFYSLGLGEVFPISSINGSGTGELLDHIVLSIADIQPYEMEADIPRFAVVGKPNVGKSSIINALIGEERNIVTPISGTTRDTIFTKFQKFGFNFYLLDTAGIRKKQKVIENVEFYSVMRSISAIENSDVCLLLIDAVEGFNAQDRNIFALIQRNHKGIVILVNKWDLIEKHTNSVKEYTEKIHEEIAPFTDVPIVFISVHEKQRVIKALEEAVNVYNNRIQKISTSKLNDFILPIINATPPPIHKGKEISIKFATQIPTHYPSFAFFCNLPQYVKESYKRFLENKLRAHFDLKGVPIEIYFRKK